MNIIGLDLRRVSERKVKEEEEVIDIRVIHR